MLTTINLEMVAWAWNDPVAYLVNTCTQISVGLKIVEVERLNLFRNRVTYYLVGDLEKCETFRKLVEPPKWGYSLLHMPRFIDNKNIPEFPADAFNPMYHEQSIANEGF